MPKRQSGPEAASSVRITVHLLTCAWWIARDMATRQPIDLAELRAMYRHLPTEGTIGGLDMLLAEDLLMSTRLVVLEGEILRSTSQVDAAGVEGIVEGRLMLLAAIWERTRPTWLELLGQTAQVADTPIPEHVAALVEDAFDDPNDREAFLLAMARRVDLQVLGEIGTAGEEAVVYACKEALGDVPGKAELVRRVSLISDQLGYDVVSPTIYGDTMVRIEVKTVGREPVGDVRVFLSRNEARVGLLDENWRLVVCARPRPDVAQVIGWAKATDLAPYFPSDIDPRGEWQSVRLTFPLTFLQPGLPL